MAARPGLALMALGYGTLTMLRSVVESENGADAAALAVHWQLDRILRECWTNAGIPPEEACQAAEIALAVLARTGPAAAETYKAAKTPAAIAAALILENYDAADFRKILGVNRFDDVTWFNKESFEQALFLVPFFLSLDSSLAFGKKSEKEKERQKRIETIADVAEVFRAAEKKSGYRFDELSGALSEQ
jgi:hypothetical protein